MKKQSVPLALVVMVAAGALIAALTAAAKPVPASQFAASGHWVFNSDSQTVFHIDGPTGNIDAHAAVPGEAGSQVVQGDTRGYVVGFSVIIEFSKATLAVQRTIDPPANELPVGIEAAGGPYLVYRNVGKIVRLGEPVATVSVGGAVGTPIVTPDGTMWLHRKDVGRICTLGKGADRIGACSVDVPPRHPGALTTVDRKPAFVDTFTGLLHVIDGDKLGAGMPLGVPLSPDARPAGADLGGRVAILDPHRQSLVLADARNPSGKPVTVSLPSGDYDGPVSNGDVVVLVDKQSGTVLTFGSDGARKDTKPITQKTGSPKLSRGDDNRIYVEDTNGTQVLVVAQGGTIQDVAVTQQAVSSSTRVPTPTVPTQPTRPTGQQQQPIQQQQAARGETPKQRPTSQRTTPPAVAAARPGAPGSVSAAAGDGSATVNWAAAPDNRAPITSYQISWRSSTGQTGSVSVGGGQRSVTVNGLANGSSHVFTVTAVNRVGTGAGASAQTTPQSPIRPPGQPGNLYARIKTGDTDANVTWTAATPNGAPVTAYRVSWRRDDGSLTNSTQVSGSTLSFLIEDLGIERPFTVTVVAENSAGRGPAATYHKTQGDRPS